MAGEAIYTKPSKLSRLPSKNRMNASLEATPLAYSQYSLLSLCLKLEPMEEILIV